MKYVAILTALALGSFATLVSAEEGHGHRGGKMIEHLKAADTNGDGMISLAEAQAKLPRIAANFGAIDTNRDGQLTFDELRAFHQKMRAAHTQKVDTDGDGRISKAEYLARAAARFDRLDVNHDGFLTPDERPSGHRRGPGH